jgi:hypothetical protein
MGNEMNRNSIILLLAGLVIGFIIGSDYFKCNPYKSDIVISDTTYLYFEKDTIIYREIKIDTIIYNPVIRYKEAPISVGEDSVFIYSDTIRMFPKLEFYYKASITGRLNWISLGYKDLRPERIIERNYLTTINNTKLIRPDRFNFFAGGEVGKSNIAITGYLTTSKMIYSYKYNVFDNSHSAAVGIKLFSK